MTLLKDALALASAGWPVFALNGKTPYRNCETCLSAAAGCECRGHLLCHAFYAATTDERCIRAMWEALPRSNIGLRPPPGFFVLDVDPRHPKYDPLVLAKLRLPETRRSWSGREDGGHHLWFRGRRPLRKLGHGLDIKDEHGYVVAPPSLHPATGLPYRWELVDAPILEWPAAANKGSRTSTALTAETGGPRYASAPGRWEDVLFPHGWTTNGRGDWVHPTASTVLSARVVDDLLYVFSTSTDFEPTTGGAPRGYDRVEAYCLLNGLDFNSFDFLIAVEALS